MGYTERGIAHLACFLTKDCTEQALFGCKLGLTLRGNLTYKNITCSDLCTDADNTALVKITESVITNIGNVASDFLTT